MVFVRGLVDKLLSACQKVVVAQAAFDPLTLAIVAPTEARKESVASNETPTTSDDGGN